MREVSVGIIRRNGLILICQRRRDAVYPLKWEFPGGKIEVGERPEEALRRELREELAIEAVVTTPFHRQEWTYPAGLPDSARNGTFRIFYFMVDRFQGEPENHAFEQIRWRRPHELAAMDLLDGNRDAVRMLIAREARGGDAEA